MQIGYDGRMATKSLVDDLRAVPDLSVLDYLTAEPRPFQLVQMRMIRDLIEERCPDEVLWAAGFGTAVERLLLARYDSSVRRPRARLEVLIVAEIPDFLERYRVMAERVLGKVFSDTGKWIEPHIVTAADLERAVEANDKTMRRIASASVSIYGTPDAAIERTQSVIS